VTFEPNQQPSPFPPAPDAPPAPGQPTPSQPMPSAPQPAVASFIPPTVAAAVARPQARGGASASTIAFVAAIVVAAAGLGFAGGRLTAPASANSTARGNFGGGFANFANGSFNPNAANRGFGGAALGAAGISIDGHVTAVGNGSITIQTSGGESVTLQVPSTVSYHAQGSATAADVTVGSSVQVNVDRGARPDASGQPAASGATDNRAGGLGMTVTEITVLGK
jgi:hypothetical protein